ncbi:hypothetical protein QU24_18510 [Pantoea rodasii]|uniref:Two-component-system connector protein YcgZ n=1 Tax=Pantoea rodasii TaxID=1076549 RepID=A0A0B1R4K1_9GAMM|nr:biofilm development regulator YmgB/AriR family protein [Pantoea rodasii]KHJ66586.1 hypothetical protein QU24_18510 [Pantoea rodasii]
MQIKIFSIKPSGNGQLFLKKQALISEKEALGSLVTEILTNGKPLSRKTLCLEVLNKLDGNEDVNEKMIYNSIFKKLLGG